MRALRDRPIPHRVKRDGDGQRLDEYLLRVVPRTTPEEVAEAIAAGRFRWRGDEEPLAADAVMVAGETLMADVPDMTPADPFLPTPSDAPDVLFHDEALFVVNKPAGQLCYPLGPRKVAAQSLAEAWLEAQGESPELRPLHRIDRETSGVLMFARHKQADRRVKKAFQRRAVEKSYLALVRGHVSDELLLIDGPIGPEGKDIRIKMAVREDGQEATTEVRVLGRFGDDDFGEAGRGYSWVEARPRTGRTHQIRLHLAHAGHPLVGDKLYIDGGRAFLRWWDGDYDASDVALLGLARHALHAWNLALRHPMDGEVTRFRAPVPADLLEFARGRGGGPPPEPRPLPRPEPS